MQEQQLAVLVEPILVEAGLELDSLEVTPIGKRHLLRITVDGDGSHGHGPVLDDISAASARISAALDASGIVGDAPYTLEVTSRGVGKSLTEARHYRRNRGHLVRLNLAEGECVGRILHVTDTGVVLDVGGVNREVSFDQVHRARVQVELNPPKEFALPGEEAGNEEEA